MQFKMFKPLLCSRSFYNRGNVLDLGRSVIDQALTMWQVRIQAWIFSLGYFSFN